MRAAPHEPRPGSRSLPRTLWLGAVFLAAPLVSLAVETRDGHPGQVVVEAVVVVAVVVALVWLRRAEVARSRAEVALRASEERHRSLIQHASDVFVVLDERAVVTYAATSSKRVFGIDPTDLVGRSAVEVVHPDDVPLVRSTFAAGVGQFGKVGGLEVRILDGKGEWRWSEVHYQNLLSDPSVGGIVLSVRDITDRFAAEAAFRERESQYHSLFAGNRAVMLLMDPVTGEIVDANAAALDFYGYPLEILVKGGAAALRADPPEVVEQEMRRAEAEGRPVLRLRHRLASGEIRHVELYTGAIAVGGRALLYEIVHDVTERLLAEEALRAAETSYRTLVEQLPVITYVYRFDRADPSRTVGTYVGPQIEEMLGVTPQEWLADPGMWASMVHPDDLARVDREGLAARASGTSIVAEYRMRRRDGGEVWIHDSSVPILDDDGEAVAWQGIYQDITERRSAEDVLRRQALIFEAVHDSVVVSDRRGRIVDVNPATERAAGRSRLELIGRPAEEVLGAEDPAGLREAIEASLAERGRWSGIVSVRRAEATEGYVELEVAPLRDREGSLLGSVGVSRDITEKRRAELGLRASERRFRAVFDGAAVGIASLSLDGHVLEANGVAAELLGVSRKELLGVHLGSFLAGAGAGRVPEEFARLAAGGLDRYEADRQFVRRGGDRIWCHVSASLVRDEAGEPDFAIVMLEDITPRKAAEGELARRALHDPLTDLPNRDLLLDRLGIALARMERGGPGVAVMFLDLDGFKRVNDELGHEAGDGVLREVARRFGASVRPADTVARYGGDEFVVLCEDVWSAPDAVATAERLVRCLDDPLALPGGATVKVGASIGVTLARDRSRDRERLIRDADTAMYRAKQGAGGPAISDRREIVVLDDAM